MQIVALAQVVAMAALAMNATAPTGDSWTPVAQTDESIYLLDFGCGRCEEAVRPDAG